MITRSLGVLLFVIAVLTSSVSTHLIYTSHLQNRDSGISRLIYFPEAISKIVSLEFSGLVADYLQLKTMVFIGERLMNKEPLQAEEWQTVYTALRHITNLDPKFWDPYVLAATSLPWDAGMVDETVHLLEKAATERQNDHRPYFFLWYLKYHFENDYKAAGDYLELAAEKPGAPDYYATLAARMKLYSGDIMAGVIFLEETLKTTSSPATRAFLAKRIEALKRIAFLEVKIQEYRKKFNSSPHHLNELLEKGIVTKLPDDPYGGNFYIMENGRVYSTSKLVEVKKTEGN